MMNRKHNPILFLLCCIMFFQCQTTDVYGGYAIINSPGQAKVLEIMDGDAIKVQMIDTGETALVRLSGIDAKGYNKAVTYLNNELLGHVVDLRTDTSHVGNSGRWNMMYVFKAGVLVNSVLLEKGYAKVMEDYKGSMSDAFAADEESGKIKQIGIWTPDKGYKSSNWYYMGDGVNINTCSSELLVERLSGMDSSTAANIVNYRNYNPFNIASEIKFVSGLTREMYAANRNLLTVGTNINLATEKELLTLKEFTQEDVKRILDYREKNSFTSINQLISEELISQSKFNLNQPYIDIVDMQEIFYAIPNRTVNINTASRNQLMNAGLNSWDAERIVNSRGKYSFKHIGELSFMLPMNELNKYADNLTTVTDINHASIDEIRSLFGEGIYSGEADKLYYNRPYINVSAARGNLSEDAYNSIEKYIVTTNYQKTYLNINTATLDQLKKLDMTESEAIDVYNKRRWMTEPRNIPIDISPYEDKVSLYTNINTAGYEEINSLLESGGSVGNIVNEIISARANQPFGSIEELKEFFEQRGYYGLFNYANSFIILR